MSRPVKAEIVHVRVTPEQARILRTLADAFEWTPSEVLRRALDQLWESVNDEPRS